MDSRLALVVFSNLCRACLTKTISQEASGVSCSMRMSQQCLLGWTMSKCPRNPLSDPLPGLQVAEDGDRDVHAALHGLLLCLEDADVGPEEGLLGPDGEAKLEAAVRPALYDLRYNPARYTSWNWLAGALCVRVRKLRCQPALEFF